MAEGNNDKTRWRVIYGVVTLLVAAQGAQLVVPESESSHTLPNVYTVQMANADKQYVKRELQYITDAAIKLTEKFEQHLTLAMHQGTALVVEQMRGELGQIRTILIDIRERLKPKK